MALLLPVTQVALLMMMVPNRERNKQDKVSETKALRFASLYRKETRLWRAFVSRGRSEMKFCCRAVASSPVEL